MILLSALVLALAGCSTVNSRIRQHADEFNHLAAADQTKIREGIVDVGFTPNMVYMALGAPDVKRVHRARTGTRETWIYRTSYETYEGTRLVTYRRWYRHDPFHRRYHVFWGPAYADVYRVHHQDRIRVTFRNNEVVAIDDDLDHTK